jgi:hypothetical protein
MGTFVTGYQYGDRNQFIGTYKFELYGEFEPRHSPNLTLTAPPQTPEGQEAIWTGIDWVLKDKPGIPEAPKLPEPEIVPVPEYIAPVIPS